MSDFITILSFAIACITLGYTIGRDVQILIQKIDRHNSPKSDGQ